MSENTSLSEWALAYHRAGWGIFPCYNKQPLVGWDFLRQHRILESKIIEWWTRWPTAQIALVCGEQSGVTVIDVDWVKDPVTRLILPDQSVDPTELASRIKNAPQVISGSKGRHIYFKYFPSKNSVGQIHKQMDVRTEGGYVILPPSSHYSGHNYEWDPNYPDWFLELPEAPDTLKTACKQTATGNDWKKFSLGVPSGSRNMTAAKIIGKILPKFRRDVDFAWELVLAWNSRNNPPLDHSELERTFKSILKADYAKYKHYYS